MRFFFPVGSVPERESRFDKNRQNGHKSARGPHRKEETHNWSKVSWFLFKSLHIHRLQKQSFFFPKQTLIIRRLRNSADAHISCLGYLWKLAFDMWTLFRTCQLCGPLKELLSDNGLNNKFKFLEVWKDEVFNFNLCSYLTSLLQI